MGAAESALQKTVTPEFLFLDNWVPELELLPNGTRLSNGTPLPNATRRRFFIRLKVPPEFRDITSPPLPEHLDFTQERNTDFLEVVTPVDQYRFNSESRLFKLYKLRIEETDQLIGDRLYLNDQQQDAFIMFSGERFEYSSGLTQFEIWFSPVYYGEVLNIVLLDLDLNQTFYEGLREQIAALPQPEPANVPATGSYMDAQERAFRMGIGVENCRWIEYSPEVCRENSDPITFEEFKTGDMVWQTSTGHCLGPDSGVYQPARFQGSDILMNPNTRASLPDDCYSRTRKDQAAGFWRRS